MLVSEHLRKELVSFFYLFKGVLSSFYRYCFVPRFQVEHSKFYHYCSSITVEYNEKLLPNNHPPTNNHLLFGAKEEIITPGYHLVN